MRQRNAIALAQLTSMSLCVTAAHSHSVSFGVTGLPAQALHPLLTPNQLGSILIIGFLASRHWPTAAWASVTAFVAGIAAGWVIQYALPDLLPSYWIVAYGALLIAGIAATVWPTMPIAGAMAVAALLGLVFGLETYNDFAPWMDAIAPPAIMTLTVGVSVLLIGWLLSRRLPDWALLVLRLVMIAIALYAGVMLTAEWGN